MWAVDSVHVYLVIVGLHVLGATVWTGGHLVLALAILPGALKARDPARLLAFEHRYARVGLPALLLQIATGLWLALQRAPDWAGWLTPDSTAERAVTLKLATLLATVTLAASARFFVLPSLTVRRLPLMAAHIVAVTVLSVVFVVLGVSFRRGGI